MMTNKQFRLFTLKTIQMLIQLLCRQNTYNILDKKQLEELDEVLDKAIVKEDGDATTVT